MNSKAPLDYSRKHTSAFKELKLSTLGILSSEEVENYPKTSRLLSSDIGMTLGKSDNQDIFFQGDNLTSASGCERQGKFVTFSRGNSNFERSTYKIPTISRASSKGMADNACFCNCQVEQIKEEYLNTLDKLQLYEEKANKYDDLFKEHKTLSEELEQLRLNNRYLTEYFEKLGKEKSEIEEKIEKLKQQNHELTTENIFVTSSLQKVQKELTALQLKMKNDSTKAKILSDKHILDLKNKDANEKLLNQRISELQNEIKELKESKEKVIVCNHKSEDDYSDKIISDNEGSEENEETREFQEEAYQMKERRSNLVPLHKIRGWFNKEKSGDMCENENENEENLANENVKTFLPLKLNFEDDFHNKYNNSGPFTKDLQVNCKIDSNTSINFNKRNQSHKQLPTVKSIQALQDLLQEDENFENKDTNSFDKQ